MVIPDLVEAIAVSGPLKVAQMLRIHEVFTQYEYFSIVGKSRARREIDRVLLLAQSLYRKVMEDPGLLKLVKRAVSSQTFLQEIRKMKG